MSEYAPSVYPDVASVHSSHPEVYVDGPVVYADGAFLYADRSSVYPCEVSAYPVGVSAYPHVPEGDACAAPVFADSASASADGVNVYGGDVSGCTGKPPGYADATKMTPYAPFGYASGLPGYAGGPRYRKRCFRGLLRLHPGLLTVQKCIFAHGADLCRGHPDPLPGHPWMRLPRRHPRSCRSSALAMLLHIPPGHPDTPVLR